MSTTVATRPLRQVKTVQELLNNDMARQQLATVAAEHMKPQQMMRLMAGAIQKTPKLAQCEPITLLGAMMTCASLGLQPNTPLGHAYLIPFENKRKGITEVQLIIGYKGMIDLARRSGSVVNIHADVVYQGDEFSYEYGSNQHLRHVPGGNRDTPTHAYCHAKLTDGEAFIVLPYEVVLGIRDQSQGYKTAKRFNSKDTPWIAHEHQMARKTAVRALFNELPISIEKAADALTVDDEPSNFHAFAMDPSTVIPTTGEVIEGTAEDREEEEEPEQVKEPPQPVKEPPKTEKASNKKPPAVALIAGELDEATSLGAVEAVLELWADEIEKLQGSDAFQEVQDHADMRREALA